MEGGKRSTDERLLTGRGIDVLCVLYRELDGLGITKVIDIDLRNVPLLAARNRYPCPRLDLRAYRTGAHV
jgi:hypothetical protein